MAIKRLIHNIIIVYILWRMANTIGNIIEGTFMMRIRRRTHTYHINYRLGTYAFTVPILYLFI